MAHKEESSFLHHAPCPNCGSSDALAIYTDGHGFCHKCQHWEAGEEGTQGSRKEGKKVNKKFLLGTIAPLTKRKISVETCSKWNYEIGTLDSQSVHIANYKNDTGEVIAQKIRFPDKTFVWQGSPKAVGLYGQWLWRDQGKMIVITEGELDALTMSQIQDNKWPVVSVPNGAGGAKKSIQKSLEWLEGFEKVVFMFDNDEEGIKAAKECAQLLTPGKAYIAKLPLKDASDMYQAGRIRELVDAMWSAKVFRPDGIIAGTDLWDTIIENKEVESFPYPWEGLNTKTHGLRKGELVTVTAGSGIGKSQVCREIAYSLIRAEEKVGYIALEESVKRSALGLMAIHLERPIHINPDGVSEDELKLAFENTIGSGNCYFYDHWGSIDSDNLFNKIRYLARGLDCSWIVLDHLSIVVSGIGEGDERRLIDNIMTQLRALVEELGIGLILVSHLRRPANGRGHEEGVQTSLSDLRGSAAIAQLSDMVIGLERNQQDRKNSNITLVRILKNRFTGETGLTCALEYVPGTGRLIEHLGFLEADGKDLDDSNSDSVEELF